MKIMKRISSLLTLVCDANGNITDYIDGSGNVVAHREFDPCGNTIVATGAMVNDFNFWFSSKYFDQETGMYYYGFRLYSTRLARWVSRDPIVEQGMLFALFQVLSESSCSIDRNSYLFVLNDPIEKIDILGLKDWDCAISETRVCACSGRCKAYCKHRKQGYCDCVDSSYNFLGPWDEGSNSGFYFSLRCCFKKPFDPNMPREGEINRGAVWEDIPFRDVKTWKAAGGSGDCCLP